MEGWKKLMFGMFLSRLYMKALTSYLAVRM